MTDSGRVGDADQALAVPATPASAVDGPTGFDPSRKPMGFFVALFNCHVNNARARARDAMLAMGDHGRVQLREIDALTAASGGLMHVGQIWPTAATRCYMSFVAQFVNEDVVAHAIAMEARQGGDGETRLHPKDDSAGRKASPLPSHRSPKHDR